MKPVLQHIYDILQPAFSVVGAALVALALFISIFDAPRTYKQECRDFSIVQAGLLACHRDNNCNLADDEVFEMYTAGKAAVIACQRWTKVEEYLLNERLLEEAEAELDEILEEPDPKPELSTRAHP
jgi:hypothetical protein